LLALPRHLSTTRPCSPGEKTRQPTPRTHLVSSGPSIRRGPSLVFHLSLASSLFSPSSVPFSSCPSLSLSLSLSLFLSLSVFRPNVFTVSPLMVPSHRASRSFPLSPRQLRHSPRPSSPLSLSLSLFLARSLSLSLCMSVCLSFVGDTKARTRGYYAYISRREMLIGDRRQLSNYRHSGRSRA
jgi:hypothetical protein